MTTATAAPLMHDDRYDEVWDGVPYMPPVPNVDHQDLVAELTGAFFQLVRVPRLGRVYPGLNVSDRADDWRENFRCPDVAVYLNGNPAIRHVTHRQGGPDFAVEIVSPGGSAHAKLGFYSAVNTHEVLVIRRAAAWELELFRHNGASLALLGQVSEAGGVVESEAVGVTFRLEAGGERPALVVTHPASGRSWRA